MYDKARKEARICIRVTEAQHQKIKQASEKENRTISGYLENVICWWLGQQGGENK